jgi:hypothetical protein
VEWSRILLSTRFAQAQDQCFHQRIVIGTALLDIHTVDAVWFGARSPVPFKCPICSCPEYQRVVVPRQHGAPYVTDFLCCLGCSVMFIDPELFTAATAFRVEVEGAARGAPEASLQSHALHARFWIARAKTLNGGWEATSEEMLRLRERYRQ